MKKEIESLKDRMSDNNIDLYMITTTDAHNSEYVSDHDKVLEYMTGFTGSNGTLLVTPKEALLWTDGRYYIQCEKELEGSGIRMMRQGDDRDPSVEDYIGSHLQPGQCIGYDGRCITKYMADKYVSVCVRNGCTCVPAGTEHHNNSTGDKYIYVNAGHDLAGEIWDASSVRPKAVCGRIREHELKYAGEDRISKLSRVADRLRADGCKHLFISKPDDIMWLFNIRGRDITYNPVALSYAFISLSDNEAPLEKDSPQNCPDTEAYLFIHADKMDDKLKDKLISSGIIIKDYDEVYRFLKEYDYKGNILADIREISTLTYELMDEASDSYSVVNHINPTTELKAVKNETEIGCMKEYFKADSKAMTGYLYAVKRIMECADADKWRGYIDAAYADGIDELIAQKGYNADDFDELKAGRLCDELRLSVADCFDLSFTTIAAYGANAAMMHYEATDESYSGCKKKGMLLTDCGGQYPGATTDVTRTIALGPVTDEEKRCFTLVLKGWLALMHAVWIEGCTGRNLDILARGYLWNEGIDYKCGTGHGVGCCLSVHEGPQNIRWRYIPGSAEAVLKPGMTVTDEPGVYKEGRFGIRTENTLLVVRRFESEGDTYLGFENLTYVPIDEELIDMSLLDVKEKAWLEEYQSKTLQYIG